MNGKKEGKKLDFDEAIGKLKAAGELLESKSSPPKEEREKILKERARLLSREEEKKEDPSFLIEAVEFMLAHERYLIEAGRIDEVYPLTELTPLPCTPPFVLGIINVRGRILSVIDLRKFFELPEKGITDLNKVIILSSPEMEFGVLADRILGTRHIRSSELSPALPTFTGIREEYLKGITPDRAAFLDAEKLLSDNRIIINDKVEL